LCADSFAHSGDWLCGLRGSPRNHLTIRVHVIITAVRIDAEEWDDRQAALSISAAPREMSRRSGVRRFASSSVVRYRPEGCVAIDHAWARVWRNDAEEQQISRCLLHLCGSA
jgi:hypothetical protein